MAPPDTIWHKESLKLKEIFGTREGFEICPNKFSQRPIISPPCTTNEGHCQTVHERFRFIWPGNCPLGKLPKGKVPEENYWVQKEIQKPCCA